MTDRKVTVNENEWVRSANGLWHRLRSDTTGPWSSAACGRNLQVVDSTTMDDGELPDAESRCMRCSPLRTMP